MPLMEDQTLSTLMCNDDTMCNGDTMCNNDTICNDDIMQLEFNWNYIMSILKVSLTTATSQPPVCPTFLKCQMATAQGLSVSLSANQSCCEVHVKTNKTEIFRNDMFHRVWPWIVWILIQGHPLVDFWVLVNPPIKFIPWSHARQGASASVLLVQTLNWPMRGPHLPPSKEVLVPVLSDIMQLEPNWNYTPAYLTHGSHQPTSFVCNQLHV